MGFAELHFHLLPGVDDGPETVADSLALAELAVGDGTEWVVATPHVRPQLVSDPLEVPGRVRELQGELDAAGIPLTVASGGEIGHEMVERLSNVQLDAIAHGPGGARWVLLESPFAGRDAEFTAAADELRARGFAVLLAHPERSRPSTESAAALAHELAAGTVLQVNAWSITGDNGPEIEAEAARLLARHPDAVLASDAHGPNRPPALSAALGALRARGESGPERRPGAGAHALLRRGIPRRTERRAA